MHLTESNSSLGTISSALYKKSSPVHVFCRQDVGGGLEEEERAGGTDRKSKAGLGRGH